jgi:hypothetical protein
VLLARVATGALPLLLLPAGPGGARAGLRPHLAKPLLLLLLLLVAVVWLWTQAWVGCC